MRGRCLLSRRVRGDRLKGAVGSERLVGSGGAARPGGLSGRCLRRWERFATSSYASFGVPAGRSRWRSMRASSWRGCSRPVKRSA